MSEEQPIIVRIMDIEYRVACPPEEADDLREAAEQLSRTMQDIRDTGKVLGTERVAVMAALNLSYELLRARHQLEALDAATGERVRELLDRLDAAAKSFEPDTIRG